MRMENGWDKLPPKVDDTGQITSSYFSQDFSCFT